MIMQLIDLAQDWNDHLVASAYPPNTLRTYNNVLDQFMIYLVRTDHTQNIGDIKRRTIESYFKYRRDNGKKPRDLAKHYSILRVFFEWVRNDDEVKHIDYNPVANIRRPIVPPEPLPIPKPAEISALIDSCLSDEHYYVMRNFAILLFAIDTGCRASEIASIRIPDVDFIERTVDLIGKGNKPRTVKFGVMTEHCIQKYLIERATYRYAERSDHLWIGKKGPLGYNGLNHMLKKLCSIANIEPKHLHEMRHLFAAEWKMRGASDKSLMTLMGHSSTTMLQIYGAWVHQQLALDEYKSPIDEMFSKQ